jgi:hypothetical protein
MAAVPKLVGCSRFVHATITALWYKDASESKGQQPEEIMGGRSGRDQRRRERQVYRCFLVRCRLEDGAGPAGEPVWRFTVQQAGPDAARRSFACLHDVAAHVEAELMSCGGFAGDGERGRHGDVGRWEWE